MSPYYLKEGESLNKWGGEPKDIRDKNGRSLGVTIFKHEKDPEMIDISVHSGTDTYVLGNRLKEVIFPGVEEVLNRSSFEVINAITRKTVAKVIYREKPSKK